MLNNLPSLKWRLPLALMLAGCEGSTMMTHTFHNHLDDTLHFSAQWDSLPWHDTVDVAIPPGTAHTVYTYDMLGKCTRCGGLQDPTVWIDSLVLLDREWLDYPGAADDWQTVVSEGFNWITFDHTLHLGVSRVE